MSAELNRTIADSLHFVRVVTETALRLTDRRTTAAVTDGLRLMAFAADLTACIERLHDGARKGRDRTGHAATSTTPHTGA